jgi:DNA modification methylase
MSDHRVILADCLGPEGLATLADKSVDHVIADPPYSEKVHGCARSRSMRPEPGKGRAALSRSVDLGFEHLTDEIRTAAAREFARLSRRWVLVFADLEGLHGWRIALTAAGLDYVRGGIWVREGCTPQFTGDRPAAACEAIIIAHQPGRKRWNGGGRHALWSEPIVLNRGGKDPRVHTTQKPVPLMEALVRDFTDEGETVLDPFAGSGTTGVACRRLGRRFLGFERDPKYAAIAEKRIAGAREQLRFFEGVGA